jgi:phage terminase large subunit
MQINFLPQYKFLFQPRRYKVAVSGRSAGKSYAFALALLILGLKSQKRILCTREFQVSISDSVHKLLSDLNTKYNLGYEVLNNTIRHPQSKTEFLFYGLKTNVSKLKSLEGIDIVFLEEAENISQQSLDILIPTIRKEGSEIWLVFNPSSTFDAVYKTYVTPFLSELSDNGSYTDQTHHILKTGYWDNPHNSAETLLDIEKMRDEDYEKYLHIYKGDPISDTELSLIKPKYFDAAIDAHIKLNFEAVGHKALGYDPSDTGSDNQAVVHRHGSVVKNIHDWEKYNLDEGVKAVHQLTLDNKINEVIFDVVGVGTGVKYMMSALDPNKTFRLTPFSGNATPRHPLQKYKDGEPNKEVFRNLRAQYYWSLKDRFEATYNAVVHGQYIDPDKMISISSDCEHIELLKYELTNIRRKRGAASSRILIESKDDMRKRGMKSPNIADALMYVFSGEVEFGNNITIPEIIYASQW